MEWTVTSCGPQAWLLRFGDDFSEAVMGRALSLAQQLQSNPPLGLREFTMGYASVLLEFGQDGQTGFARLSQRSISEVVEGLKETVTDHPPRPSRTVEIPVVYDGEDLSEVASRTGLSEVEVIRRHTDRVYRVWLLGLSPGFPYLGVLDPSLRLPRRATPRVRISRGSVAIAGAQTGIYPSESAGGWHLIGRTSRILFDPDRRGEPFLLRPADAVRFVAVGEGDV